MGAARKYDSEFVERAVRMYRDRLASGTDSKVGARRHVAASSCRPRSLNRSLIGTCTPSLASTAWTSHLHPERNATSLARCRTSSRSSRVAGGAIHAAGRRPIRSRSARSLASRTSFFTRRYANPFTPNGCARWTCAPPACRASTAQYQPYVASSTTCGASPERAITAARESRSLVIRTTSNASPASVVRTITDLLRCRSIPTNCEPSYSDMRGLLESEGLHEHSQHEHDHAGR